MATTTQTPETTLSAKVTTLHGIVENGQIRLAGDVRLPENVRVYVVIPGIDLAPASHINSPRLAHPEQVTDFEKRVTEEISDARV